jgi:hypothetical protein
MVFVISDEWHAEHLGEFESFAEAIEQLKYWAAVPWDESPNRAPCMSWRTCGRSYKILKYEGDEVLSAVAVLNVSERGTEWLVEVPSE